MGSPTLSILIVSYNTRGMIVACLRSVFEHTTRTPFEVIVVDNKSADGSADAIEMEFGGRVTLIRSEGNLGFARANNLAADRASGEYLLLLNPDTVVLDGAIDRLVEFAGRRPEAGIWGGRTVFADGTLNPGSCWGRLTIWSLLCQAAGFSSLFRRSQILNPEGYGGWCRDSERAVDIVTGCFFLTTMGLWQALGGFDTAFFMYGEEADLCLRATRRGAKPAITPNATIVHHGGASEPVRLDKMLRLLSAKSLLIERHWSRRTAWIGLGLLQCWIASRAIAWRVMALVGQARASANALMWRELLYRRAEWLPGIAPRDASGPATGVKASEVGD